MDKTTFVKNRPAALAPLLQNRRQIVARGWNGSCI
jgi:hypothetical protein